MNSAEFQFQRRQFDIDGPFNLTGSAAARGGECLCRLIVGGRRACDRFAEPDEPGFASFEPREIVTDFLLQGWQGLDRDAEFAARCAQGKQPFLDLLQLAWIVARDAQRFVERLARRFEGRQGCVEGVDRRRQQIRRLRTAPLQPPQG